MPLPILQTRAEPSPSNLMRLFDKTDFRMAQQLADEELLACGAAFANPELPDVQNANHVREAALPGGMTPGEAVGEVDRYFAGRGSRCQYWIMNRSASVESVAPLVGHLVAAGFAADSTDVMYLRRMSRGPVQEVGGVSVISARASYRHARQLAEEVAREYGMPDVARAADAHMLRLDDPHWDALLALKDGRAVARAYVLSVGDMGRVEFVYVSKAYRGQGIGRTLMGRALEVCARSLFRHVFLSVDAGNRQALGLYSKMGFERVGEVVKYRAPVE